MINALHANKLARAKVDIFTEAEIRAVIKANIPKWIKKYHETKIETAIAAGNYKYSFTFPKNKPSDNVEVFTMVIPDNKHIPEEINTAEIAISELVMFFKKLKYNASYTDSRINQVIESWAGHRPVIHYSQSRSEYISQFSYMPTMDELLQITAKGKLRAHSDFYLNKHINKWALSHLEWADIQCESKGKNLACELLMQEI
jgi:hypothetical protein